MSRGLLNIAIPTVIKGNYSEIQSLYQESYRSSGVDADSSLDIHTIEHAALSLARSFGTVILASGKVDIIKSNGSAGFCYKVGRAIFCFYQRQPKQPVFWRSVGTFRSDLEII